MEHVFKTIKFNCDVSDARYWGYFSVCGLLMRMRDLYRSEQSLKPWEPIPKEPISEWISEKEKLWKDLESKELNNIYIGNNIYTPYDIESINLFLNPSGYVYGAGYGLYMKPTFFISELIEKKEINDYTVYISKKELVRDLFASSAMLQGRCIFVRIEPLKTLLWEKLMELKTKEGSSIKKAFLRYGISPEQLPDEGFERALEEMAFKYSEMLLYHEMAEAIEDMPGWTDLLSKIKDRRLELILRALKDLIADTSDYGPIKRALDKRDFETLRLYMDFIIGGYRLVIYPQIRYMADSEDMSQIEETRKDCYRRLTKLRQRILEFYIKGKPDEIKELLKLPINNI